MWAKPKVACMFNLIIADSKAYMYLSYVMRKPTFYAYTNNKDGTVHLRSLIRSLIFAAEIVHYF